MHSELITYLFLWQTFWKKSTDIQNIIIEPKTPVRSPVKYAIVRIQAPDHNVHERKMASEEGTGRDVTDTDVGVAATWSRD